MQNQNQNRPCRYGIDCRYQHREGGCLFSHPQSNQGSSFNSQNTRTYPPLGQPRPADYRRNGPQQYPNNQNRRPNGGFNINNGGLNSNDTYYRERSRESQNPTTQFTKKRNNQSSKNNQNLNHYNRGNPKRSSQYSSRPYQRNPKRYDNQASHNEQRKQQNPGINPFQLNPFQLNPLHFPSITNNLDASTQDLLKQLGMNQPPSRPIDSSSWDEIRRIQEAQDRENTIKQNARQEAQNLIRQQQHHVHGCPQEDYDYDRPYELQNLMDQMEKRGEIIQYQPISEDQAEVYPAEQSFIESIIEQESLPIVEEKPINSPTVPHFEWFFSKNRFFPPSQLTQQQFEKYSPCVMCLLSLRDQDQNNNASEEKKQKDSQNPQNTLFQNQNQKVEQKKYSNNTQQKKEKKEKKEKNAFKKKNTDKKQTKPKKKNPNKKEKSSNNSFDKNTLVRLYCGRIYHKACIKIWLQHHAQCPICRIDFRMNEAYAKYDPHYKTRISNQIQYPSESEISQVDALEQVRRIIRQTGGFRRGLAQRQPYEYEMIGGQDYTSESQAQLFEYIEEQSVSEQESEQRSEFFRQKVDKQKDAEEKKKNQELLEKYYAKSEHSVSFQEPQKQI